MNTMRSILISSAVLALCPFSVNAEEKVMHDPVKASPHYYKVLLDNEKVRVSEFRMEPGKQEGWQTWCPNILYVLDPGTVQLTDRTGASTAQDVKAGDIAWRVDSDHSGANVGTTDLHALMIEVKTPACKYVD